MKCTLYCLATGVAWLSTFTSWAQTAAASNPVRFEFKEPGLRVYHLEEAGSDVRAVARFNWLTARPEGNSRILVEFGDRIVLQLHSGARLDRVLSGRPLQLAREFAPNVFILQAPDARTALREADQLARLPEVAVSHPVGRRRLQLHGPYAPKPNDPYFQSQWHLENRDADGAPLGVDLNVRAAWSWTRGERAVVAIADTGVELTHPELAPRGVSALHFSFVMTNLDGMPSSASANHGTAVAGLAVAEGENRRGISGVAPAARLASWVIFDANEESVSDEQLANMFQYRSNLVTVQNHSWGSPGGFLSGPSFLEQVAISNAVQLGRAGNGVIMVRTAGNGREYGDNANDDGYPSDPQAIAVGSVRLNGRVVSYSNPGACLLVAAPAGDNGTANLFTTDRQGSIGYNQGSYTNDLADYAFDTVMPFGTSFSAPQISGLAALIVSANTNLGYRDVQQILIFSTRHFDLTDPDVVINAAGFRHSHNAGFGVPDAGQAVALARGWINRPPLAKVTLNATNPLPIPDGGFVVHAAGQGVPAGLLSIPAQAPEESRHPDEPPGELVNLDSPTASLPVVFAGLATNPISQNLTGKAALIERGTNFFTEKIIFAAQAGAVCAIIYNNAGDSLVRMSLTNFVRIPSAFIGLTAGAELASQAQTNSTLTLQIARDPARYSFSVTNELLCEHVGVRIRTDHSRRGDLRITLLSPQGTRSVLQRVSDDTDPGPGDWTYYSTRHFFESSAGTWTVDVSDELVSDTGNVLSVSLTIYGVLIVDSDRDGLDDNWELNRLGTLAYGPQDDPDGDGYSNMREQILRTDPLVNETRLAADLSPWNERLLRLNWPGRTNRNYQVLAGNDLGAPLTLMTNLPGRFPDLEWFVPFTNSTHRFFDLREITP